MYQRLPEVQRAFVVEFLTFASPTFAAEIEGKVSRIDGKQVTISSSSDLLPAVGDNLGIFVEIPGVGKASVATATVRSVDNEVIVATIDKASGTVKPGQLVTIEAPKPTKRTKPSGRTTDWGTPVNPDGDCTLHKADGIVMMEIPAGKHDLWYGGGGTFNAPRFLQDIQGDFVAQVQVTADWDTGVPPPTFHYNGGGLVVWDSMRQYLRLERNFMYNDAYGKICYATPLYDRGEKRVNGWKVADASFFQGKTTWLRIERSKKTFVTSISHDGEHWITTAVLTTEFPDKVQIGVHGIGISPRAFSVEFKDFTVTKGAPNSIASASSIPIDGRGILVDPDDDCTVTATSRRLKISVPAGAHDYWYGRKPFNAPRVLQEVAGDFEVRVKVTADWKAKPLATGSWVVGAGLIVLESERHYLRVERNRFINKGTWSYLPPIYDRNEKRISAWRAYKDGRPFRGNSTWLRIRRTGQNFTTAISHDGRRWTDSTTQATTFPNKVQVGVLALNSSAGPFSAEFEEFQLVSSATAEQSAQGPMANSIGMKLAYIPAGEFWMGSSKSREEVARILDTVAGQQYHCQENAFDVDEKYAHRVGKKDSPR